MNAHNEQHDPASAVVKQNLTTQPAAAQESAPWRDHDAAIDAKALSTATEIALMWGQDRSQFISRIQVAVIDAMRWVKGGLQPAAAQEAVAYWRVTFRMYPENIDCCETFVRGPDRPTLDTLGISPRPVQIISTKPLYAAPVTAALGIDLAALRARVVSAIERITSGTGQMRVQADLTDPDLVLADVLTLLDALDPHCTDSPKGGSEACAWAGDGEGNWHTGCGSIFMLIDGSPTDNKMRHCPYCGSHISESAQAGDAEVQP